MSRRPFLWLAAGLPLAFLGVFFVWPVVSIVRLGLGDDGEVVLAGIGGVIWFTVWQAALSTLLTLAVGLPAAWVVARYEFPGRSLLRAGTTVAFVAPTVVVASAFASLLAPIGLSRGIVAILAAHVFFNYSVVVRTVSAGLANADPQLLDAARVLGAPRWRAALATLWPLALPSIATAASVVFLFSFTSFGVILLLGGPTYSTLETEIWRATAQLLDLRTAAVLSMIQLGFVVVLLVAFQRIGGSGVAQRVRPRRGVVVRATTRGERALLWANVAGAALLLGVPVLALVERSLSTPTGHGLNWYRALAEAPERGPLVVAPLETMLTSLRIAAVASVVAVVLGTLAAVAITSPRLRRVGALDSILMLPLGVSAVTVGFGFLIALADPPLDLRSSPALVPIAHVLVATPFVVRLLVPAMQSIDQRMRDAASVLGASPGRVWREVDLPIVFRSGMVGLGFAACVSLGEFGATLFIARAGAPTAPVAIFRLLSIPGPANAGRAFALAVVLMTVTALVVLGFDRFRVGELGQF